MPGRLYNANIVRAQAMRRHSLFQVRKDLSAKLYNLVWKDGPHGSTIWAMAFLLSDDCHHPLFHSFTMPQETTFHQIMNYIDRCAKHMAKQVNTADGFLD
jgi:hypothetical protein